MAESADSISKSNRSGRKESKKRKWNREWSSAAADYATHQMVVAFGAGDASKRGIRCCSSLHSAHT